MKNLPTFRQLRFLVAVVDRCHFGKAAEDCFVSQSTLSAGVQELEDLLGIILLERTKRSVTPTPVGIEIAERARALLKDGEDLVDIALAAQDPMSGPLQLGMISTIGPFLIPRVMPCLRDAFPKLKTYLREEQTAALLARLQTGASTPSYSPCHFLLKRSRHRRSRQIAFASSAAGAIALTPSRRCSRATWRRKISCCWRTAIACASTP